MSDSLIIENIITSFKPSSSLFSLPKTFDLYDTESEQFLPFPQENVINNTNKNEQNEEKEYFLVEWQNYSFVECSWIEKSQLFKNKKIDPENKFKNYLKENKMKKDFDFQPNLHKIINGEMLIPEKILKNAEEEDDENVSDNSKEMN